MTGDAVVLAILAFAGVVVAALVAGGITLAVQLTKWYAQNQRLWFWNRQLVDHIYRGIGPPAPQPPSDLFD